MTGKHTPGPWEVEGFSDRSRPSELRLSVVEPTTRTIVALLSCADDDAEAVEATKADAALVAAAPQMADALEAVLNGFAISAGEVVNQVREALRVAGRLP